MYKCVTDASPEVSINGRKVEFGMSYKSLLFPLLQVTYMHCSNKSFFPTEYSLPNSLEACEVQCFQ